VSARHLVREVTWRDYRAIYEEFDQVARFAELTPADRHMFWVEQCQAGLPSRAAAKALRVPQERVDRHRPLAPRLGVDRVTLLCSRLLRCIATAP
jgi:FixJ family two-component response regulator